LPSTAGPGLEPGGDPGRDPGLESGPDGICHCHWSVYSCC